MQEYGNKNLILLMGIDIYQLNTLEELNAVFFGDWYNRLGEEEKFEERLKKAKILSYIYNIPIVNSKNFKVLDEKYLKTIIVDNEKLFYVSLCANDICHIYEKKNANIFVSKKRNLQTNNIIDETYDYYSIKRCKKDIISKYIGLDIKE